jgi:hypothetical protein
VSKRKAKIWTLDLEIEPAVHFFIQVRPSLDLWNARSQSRR